MMPTFITSIGVRALEGGSFPAASHLLRMLCKRVVSPHQQDSWGKHIPGLQQQPARQHAGHNATINMSIETL